MTESVGTRRGALGRTSRLLFIAFNLAMLVCIISVGGKLYLESSLATADPPSAGDALAVTRLATLAGIWALGPGGTTPPGPLLDASSNSNGTPAEPSQDVGEGEPGGKPFSKQ